MTNNIAPQPMLSRGQQVLLVGLLSLNFGIVFFDRNALGFLMPYVQPELGITNTQVGITASALSFTWALSGLIFGRLSDRSGKRKIYLVVATVAFSLCSFLTGLATTFLLLLGARLLMGASEGLIMPISHSITAETVSEKARGVAQGVAQNFGSNLLGSFAAPVLLVAFAEAFGWREAFFLAGVPGLITAALLWWVIKEPPAQTQKAQQHAHTPLSELLMERNMVICVAMSILLVSYLVITWAFLPLFLTEVRGFEPQTMGWLMGALGISATVNSFIVPAISDRVGRRPVMVITPLFGVLLPLAAMQFNGSSWMLAAMMFVGWLPCTIFPMFMATVPSESVNPRSVATAVGLSMGIGEVLGGVLSPTLAGWAADIYGLSAPLWIMLGLTIAGSVLALGLRETAPAVLQRRAAA